MNSIERSIQKVEIVSYDDMWPEKALEINHLLFSLFKNNLINIEHIGSTSIPGLASKPIIDLMPIVDDLNKLDENKDRLIKYGYRWNGEMGISGRRFCTYTSENGSRLIHLHFFQIGNSQIFRHIAFRDYLIDHPQIAGEYEKIKKEAANKFPYDSLAYSEAKSAWILKHEINALNWKFNIY